MAARKGIRKICNKGHVFYKSSDCPVCPVCENEKKPAGGFLSKLAAPARRALENARLTTLSKISKKTENEIAGLHGMGPSGVVVLRKALHEKGLNFKS
jgi:hypothetical protein